jgi:nicotinamidase-related amidase
MIGLCIAFIAFVVMLWLANGIRKIGAVSRGRLIGDRSGTVLLLIDLQAVFWDHGPYTETAKADAGSAILAEISAAKADQIPIVAVLQEWSIPSTKIIARLAMKGQGVEGTAGTEMAVPFAGLADYVLVKRVQDAFETGDLDMLLEKLGAGKLRVVGLDMAYCVAKTALAARQRGYDVEIPTQATLLANPTAAERTRSMLAEKGVTLKILPTADGEQDAALPPLRP